ncbi:MAG: hypothetical protein ACK5IN_04525 [Microbacterium sp.]|uniref:hypothetical protein n=1 Tax=Microbacterium sp. TaxID=51671 RepID=UPI003A88E418
MNTSKSHPAGTGRRRTIAGFLGAGVLATSLALMGAAGAGAVEGEGGSEQMSAELLKENTAFEKGLETKLTEAGIPFERVTLEGDGVEVIELEHSDPAAAAVYESLLDKLGWEVGEDNGDSGQNSTEGEIEVEEVPAPTAKEIAEANAQVDAAIAALQAANIAVTVSTDPDGLRTFEIHLADGDDTGWEKVDAALNSAFGTPDADTHETESNEAD